MGFLRDLGYNLRLLVKNHTSTAVIVLSLAIAIGPNCMLFSIVDGLFLRPAQVFHVDRMYQFFPLVREDAYELLGYPDYLNLRQQVPAFSDVIAYDRWQAWVTSNGVRKHVPIQAVSDNYFSVLAPQASVGRTSFPDSDQATGSQAAVVISHSLWAREFGSDPAVVGKSLILNGRGFTIVGVAKPKFRGLEIQLPVDVWVSFGGLRVLDPDRFAMLQRRGSQSGGLYVDVKLRQGVSLKQALVQANEFTARLATQFPESHRARYVELSSLAGDRAGMVAVSATILGLISLVLLVACVNIAILLMANAESRRRENAIRVALGGGRWHLIRQSLAGSLLLSVLGTGAGVIFAWWLVALVPTFTPGMLSQFNLNYDIFVGNRTFAYSLLVCLFTTLACGLFPGIKASRTEVLPALTGSADLKRVRTLRFSGMKLLVIGQIAAAQFLMCGAVLLVLSYGKTQRIPLGLDPSRRALKITLEASPEARGRAGDILQRMRSLPGVRAATFTTFVPLSGEGDGANMSVELPGHVGPGEQVSAFSPWVGPGYFQMLGTRILRGREFDERLDPPDCRKAVVNEALARRLWHGEDPVGRMLHTEIGELEIIGVVEDGKYSSVYEHERPAVFLPARVTDTLLVQTEGAPGSIAAVIQREIPTLVPGLQVTRMTSMEEVMEFALFLPRISMELVGSVALLGILLAAAGLYAVTLGAVRRRAHEVAVRTALGAQKKDILVFISSETAPALAIGISLGVGLIYASSKVVSWVLYGVSATSFLALLLSVLAVVLISVVAMQIPARQALRVDCMASLRQE